MTLSIHDFNEEWKGWQLCLYYIRTDNHDPKVINPLMDWIKQTKLEYDKYMDEMELEILHTFIWWANNPIHREVL